MPTDPKSIRVTFCAIDGAEQAIIPAPDGMHTRHHQGKNPTICHMTKPQLRTFKLQWGHMVEIISEEKFMKVRITCAEGEHVVTLPYPSAQKPTKVWEGKVTECDMPDGVIAQLQKNFKKRITIVAAKAAKKPAAAKPAAKKAPKKSAKKTAPKKKAKRGKK